MHAQARLSHSSLLVRYVPTFQAKCWPTFLFISVLIYFSLTVKAATLIFISGRGSAFPSAKQGKSGSINDLVKN